MTHGEVSLEELVNQVRLVRVGVQVHGTQRDDVIACAPLEALQRVGSYMTVRETSLRPGRRSCNQARNEAYLDLTIDVQRDTNL